MGNRPRSPKCALRWPRRLGTGLMRAAITLISSTSSLLPKGPRRRLPPAPAALPAALCSASTCAFSQAAAAVRKACPLASILAFSRAGSLAGCLLLGLDTDLLPRRGSLTSCLLLGLGMGILERRGSRASCLLLGSGAGLLPHRGSRTGFIPLGLGMAFSSAAAAARAGCFSATQIRATYFNSGQVLGPLLFSSLPILPSRRPGARSRCDSRSLPRLRGPFQLPARTAPPPFSATAARRCALVFSSSFFLTLAALAALAAAAVLFTAAPVRFVSVFSLSAAVRGRSAPAFSKPRSLSCGACGVPRGE